MSQLSPTAMNILQAAQRLLTRKGFNALSIESIANEARVTKSLIRYHFGSKAGLVEVLIDTAVHDANLALRNELAKDVKGEERTKTLIDGQFAMSANKREFAKYYEILPHVISERSLRHRVAALYDWYRSIVVWALEGSRDGLDDADAEALAALAVSVCDGLAIQLLLQPNTFDHQRAYRLWKEVITVFLRERRTLADAGSELPVQGGYRDNSAEQH